MRHSAWLLAPILGCGMLSFVGFIYVAFRVRTKKFWRAAMIASLGSATTWIVLELTSEVASNGEVTSVSDLGGGVTLAIWVALVVYAFLLNRDYLRWRANPTQTKAWYSQSNSPGQSVTPRIDDRSQSDSPGQSVTPRIDDRSQAPPPSQYLGVNQRDYYADDTSPPSRESQPRPTSRTASPSVTGSSEPDSAPPPRPVNVNSATVEALCVALGLEPQLAQRVCAVRDARGGFTDLDDLTTAVGLQPHELLKFRNKVVFDAPGGNNQEGTSRTEPKQGGPGGRILDF